MLGWSIDVGYAQFINKKEKLLHIERLCKDVCNLVFRLHAGRADNLIQNGFMNQMAINFNVFRFFCVKLDY